MATMTPTSPRLPSPPPAAEIPAGIAMVTGPHNGQVPEMSLYLDNAKRRIHPGTRARDMASGPPLVNLAELDSPFQLQEHLAALHYYHTASGTKPLTRTAAATLANPPPGVDRTLWLYELCRFLVAQCNTLIVGFLFDTPPCSTATCPEMRASEWQFLCAVHETPKSCCAIDYCCHTLDWAANVVTDPKIFPSRFVVLSQPHTKSFAVKNLVNVFRRLHRIFAHAWFQHREVFWEVERTSGLYIFFKMVCDLYELIPGDTYKLPPEAEGLEPMDSSWLPVPADVQDQPASGSVTIIRSTTLDMHSSTPPTEDASRSPSRAGMRSSGRGQSKSTDDDDDDDDEDGDNDEQSDNLDDFDSSASVIHDSEDSTDLLAEEEQEEPVAPARTVSKIPVKSPSPDPSSASIGGNSDVPVIVRSSSPVPRRNGTSSPAIGDSFPLRAKTISPKPSNGSIKPPPSKLPKKASPKPLSAKMRSASPAAASATSSYAASGIPPPMHGASGGTVIGPGFGGNSNASAASAKSAASLQDTVFAKLDKDSEPGKGEVKRESEGSASEAEAEGEAEEDAADVTIMATEEEDGDDDEDVESGDKTGKEPKEEDDAPAVNEDEDEEEDKTGEKTAASDEAQAKDEDHGEVAEEKEEKEKEKAEGSAESSW